MVTDEMPAGLSVVMPNFNKGPYLGQAIRSVLNQSYQDFELIIVDDGSTDSSLAILEEMRRDESRIRLISHPSNKGLSFSLNEGIKEARSDLLTFVGSDDILTVTRLQRIVDRLPSFALPSVIYSDPIYITRDTTTVEPEPSSRSFRPTGFILKYLLMGQFNFMGGPIAAPKACFVSAGPYDEELTWGEAFEMSLRLAKNYPFVFDPLCTYGYRIYEGNILNRISKADRWRQQSMILERTIPADIGDLKPEEKRKCFNYLFSCYLGSGSWWRLLSHGLTSREAFLSMLTLPSRRQK